MRLIGSLALDDRFRKMRIAAMSRQYLEIERVFSGISLGVSISNEMVEADIRQFTRAKLAASYRLKRWKHRHGDIEDALGSSRSPWHVPLGGLPDPCHRTSTRQGQLHAALQNLPPDLNETYIRIFDAIPEVDRPFVRHVLV